MAIVTLVPHLSLGRSSLKWVLVLGLWRRVSHGSLPRALRWKGVKRVSHMVRLGLPYLFLGWVSRLVSPHTSLRIVRLKVGLLWVTGNFSLKSPILP